MTTEIFAAGKSCGVEVAHKAFSPSNIQPPPPLPLRVDCTLNLYFGSREHFICINSVPQARNVVKILFHANPDPSNGDENQHLYLLETIK